MTELNAEPKFQRMLAYLMLTLAVVLFALQLRSLFVFPQPNSLRWFGDETWLMSEATQQITTGVVRYPLAIGSTLEHGKGLVLSMTWLSAIVYGLPAWISGADLVAAGRVITALLSIALLTALYVSARSLGASRFASVLAVLLLVSTRSFFFSSHSARSDLLAGLLVLAFVATCTKLSLQGKKRSIRWWCAYGAIVMVLAVTSSIHLLTLLGPVALFFLWRLGGFRQMSCALAAAAGAVGILAALALLYYLTTDLGPRFVLFSPEAGHVQFHDVLSSIPIFRPFSRSVQVANIITRFQQFAAEAPQVFLLPFVLPFGWKREGSRHVFPIASLVVVLSWFLFEGAEINYLIHLLPLLFLGLALAVTQFTVRWRFTTIALETLAIVFLLLGWRDSARAIDAASSIDSSNKTAVQRLEASIAATWQRALKPRVLTEPPTLDRLSQSSGIEVMTDHFISFPTKNEPLDSFFAREHVNYVVLYNSPAYPKNRTHDDSFYKGVVSIGQLVASEVGASGDIGRDYFNHSDWQDTMLLFKISQSK